MRHAALPLVATAALLVGGCADRRPAWAKRPAAGVGGDGTVSGEPLAVRRFPSPPVLDGKLDDAVWANASIAGPFVAPGDGRTVDKSPVWAFARLGWDDTKLYVGVVVEDQAPFAPFARDEVDPRIWERSSAIELMVQPGDPHDNRDYYEIQVDAEGAVFDTRWDDYNRPITGGPDEASKKFGHLEWSSKIERAIHKDKGFYAIEVAIPWAAFDHARTAVPPKAGDVWRLNLYSFRDGQRQALAWSPIRGEGNFHRAARFGRIKLEG